jgi:FkbM family methyltransferase
MNHPSTKEIHEELRIHRQLDVLFKKYVSSRDPKCFWEIGALDGQDSVEMKRRFKATHFVAFEPTPESFLQVKGNLSKIKGEALQFAISDYDASDTFFVNDPTKTVTTWKNGNQGANSLFVADPSYPVESYSQNRITVQVRRADSLIDAGLKCPQFVWLDAQGSELNILRSFGVHLTAIDFIYVELSLAPLYLETPHANEIVKFLSKNGFYWVKNPTLGGFQFDAVFVKARKRKSLARAHHKFYTWSITRKQKLYISMNFRTFCYAMLSQVVKSCFRIK